MLRLTNIIDQIKGKIPWGSKRSPEWPKVRAKHLEKHPNCAVCYGKKKLQVHHKMPFHLDPTLELNPDNLITLCESKKGGLNCHLFVGHLGNFKNFNKDVEVDALTLFLKVHCPKCGGKLYVSEGRMMCGDC